MTIIKEITPTETFHVRHPMLRSGRPVESCLFNGNNLPYTKLYGIFIAENLVGVISIFKNNNPIFKNKKHSKLAAWLF
jgi:hypothetical protein